MKLSFRWYGADDKVTLENIRQIPKMEAIVTAVYDVPVGEVWSEKSIADLKKQVEENGLKILCFCYGESLQCSLILPAEILIDIGNCGQDDQLVTA